MSKIIWLFRIVVFGILIGCIIVGDLVYHCIQDIPDYSKLANYNPPSITRLYSSDGKLIEEYSKEYRVFVPIQNIPTSLIHAFIAAEDKNFFTHPGLDLLSITRAAIFNVSNLLRNKRMEGGSTITQQVVKNFLLSSERSLTRKIKEAILSYKISQVFTKEQILELYLNQSYLGMHAYGVAMAAQNYFNKSIDELNLQESAFIAGLPKAPSNFDPNKHYVKAKERRDYVLSRMLEDGYIEPHTAKEAIESPIIIKKRDKSETITASYYASRVREEAITMLGKENFYTGGFTIITPMDSAMQKHARDALVQGIRRYDTQKGYRKAIHKIDLSNWKTELPQYKNISGLLEYKIAVVLSVSKTKANIGLDDGSTTHINIADAKWAKRNLDDMNTILSKGDVIAVEVLKNKASNKFVLKQIPEVNGGIMVMDPRNGKVLASEGGYDFNVSKFDRVTQALRQPGSLSKTFIFLAGIENGLSPDQIFDDAYIEINQGPGMPLWIPKNYKGDFLGPIPMRLGLEKSRNLITVRVAQEIGLDKVSNIIKRFEINDNPPKFYSMVLGSLETTLYKMVAAYGTIANYGHKITPHFIETIKDRHGKIVYKRDKRICSNCHLNEVETQTTPQITDLEAPIIVNEIHNAQIISMLEGAVQHGTATAAKKLNKIIAGKTGTTNDSKDVWFVGFTPLIVVGTYVGYDIPKDLGKNVSGATTALPIFIDFMYSAYQSPSLPFKSPRTSYEDINNNIQQDVHTIQNDIFKNIDNIDNIKNTNTKFQSEVY